MLYLDNTLNSWKNHMYLILKGDWMNIAYDCFGKKWLSVSQ